MLKTKTLLLILAINVVCFSQIIKPSHVIPDKVEILLSSKIYQSVRQPLLHFRYFGAGGTDHWVSNLYVDQICFQDSVIFNISGCDIADYTELYKKNQILVNFQVQWAEKNILIPKDI